MAISRRELLSCGCVTGLALLAAGPVFAHHGWSWTADGMFELEGIIKEIYIGNPHATLDVDVEGEIWRVELAPPSATIGVEMTGRPSRWARLMATAVRFSWL